MPRKPIIKSLPKKHPVTGEPVQTGQWIDQCMHCGALVNSIFVSSGGSWCPSCKDRDCVVSEIGAIPDPPMYGRWLEAQRKSLPQGNDSKQPNSVIPTVIPGGTAMKTLKTHTGIYCCLTCCVEFDLLSETSLKCDTCGGPLVKGTLDEWIDDDPCDEEECA